MLASGDSSGTGDNTDVNLLSICALAACHLEQLTLDLLALPVGSRVWHVQLNVVGAFEASEVAVVELYVDGNMVKGVSRMPSYNRATFMTTDSMWRVFGDDKGCYGEVCHPQTMVHCKLCSVTKRYTGMAAAVCSTLYPAQTLLPVKDDSSRAVGELSGQLHIYEITRADMHGSEHGVTFV